MALLHDFPVHQVPEELNSSLDCPLRGKLDELTGPTGESAKRMTAVELMRSSWTDLKAQGLEEKDP